MTKKCILCGKEVYNPSILGDVCVNCNLYCRIEDISKGIKKLIKEFVELRECIERCVDYIVDVFGNKL